VTPSDMAVVDGSPDFGTAQPVGVNARARVKQSITTRDRRRTSKTARRSLSPSRMTRLMYLDAADSWIVRESTPSLKTLWATTYADEIPAGWGPMRAWCLAYRLLAVAVAVPLHMLLFLLTHPLRGPLTVLTAAALILLATTH
jgi:hypothetical protein